MVQPYGTAEQPCTMVNEALLDHDSSAIVVLWYDYHGSIMVHLQWYIHGNRTMMGILWNSYTGKMEKSSEV